MPRAKTAAATGLVGIGAVALVRVLEACIMAKASLTVLLMNSGEPRYQATGALKKIATTKTHQNRLRIVQTPCRTEAIPSLASLLCTRVGEHGKATTKLW